MIDIREMVLVIINNIFIEFIFGVWDIFFGRFWRKFLGSWRILGLGFVRVKGGFFGRFLGSMFLWVVFMDVFFGVGVIWSRKVRL